MLRIKNIVKIESYLITSEFKNGQIVKLDVYPLIQNHLHINGVSKLLDKLIFETAKIGHFGEIFWPNIVQNAKKEILDYDISPVFFYQNGALVQ